MSIPRVKYCFRPGRLMKKGRRNPGILIVEDVRTFLCNRMNKNLDIFHYVCSERLTVGVKCRAKAIVWIYDVPGKGLKPFVEKVDRDHDCPTNIPKFIAEEMKHNNSRRSLGPPRCSRPTTVSSRRSFRAIPPTLHRSPLSSRTLS